MKKDDSVYIDHIQSSLIKIQTYIEGLDLDSFLESAITQDAVIRQLEIVGEATKRVSMDFRARNPEIPWSDMIHDYLDVDIMEVWHTASKDVSDLLNQLGDLK